jgi:glutathione S-transferase
MIKLHGFSYSNYYNIVKHVLLHKGLAFEEDLMFGSEESFRDISPLGKVPAMTTADGRFLSESSVCCDYLEEAYPENAPLYPSDPYERARVRQVMKVSELYLELSARRLIPYSIGRKPVPDVVAKEVVSVLERGIVAMNRLCTFAPYALGEEMTLADIYLRYVLSTDDIAKACLDRDFAQEIDGLEQWRALMSSTEIATQIDADREANAPAFFAYIKERFGG